MPARAEPVSADALDPAGWTISLQGTAHLRHDSGRSVLLQRLDAALIAHLALRGRTSREELVAMLWPQGDASVLHNRLRQRLFMLKRRLGVPVVQGQSSLTLNPALRWSGLREDVEAEPLLAGLEFDDLPAFTAWLAQERMRVQTVARQRLLDAVHSLEAEGRLAEALTLATRLVALDPLHEHAHRRLMRLHYLRGDRAAALQAYEACEAVLKDELSTRPCAETLQLLAQIEQVQLPARGPVARPLAATVKRPPRLIGRDDAWARLERAWTQSDAVVLVGEAGMGKTRLLGDLLQSHGAQHGLHVSARPGDERVPFALLSRLLRGLLARSRRPPAAGVRSELARLLPELSSGAVESAALAAPTGAGARARFVNAVESTLGIAAEEGLQALALDDLQFSDGASLELARHLAGSAGLRWLFAARPQADDTAAAELIRHLTATGRGTTTIRLAPLSRTQVAELVDSLALPQAQPAALTSALHRHTGGNPLFLLETLKLLLHGDGTALGLGCLGGERLPTADGVMRLVAHRLGQLSPLAIKLVRCAAIAGQDFDVALAAHVLGRRAIDLADAWAELADADVLRDAAFAHDLVRDAALSSVPEPIARALHGEVASWLEEHGGEPARIALHWQQAARPERAGPAWVEAADRCGARGRRVEESQLLQRAATAFGEAGEPRLRGDALLRRVEVLGQHADFNTALRALHEARTAVDGDEVRLRLEAAGIYLHTFHGDERYTLAHAPATLALARRLGRHDIVLRVSVPYAGTLARSARAGEAVHLLEDLRPWLETQADAPQRHEYWNAMAIALDQGSRLRESMRAWETAYQWAERYDSDLQCQVIGNMAYTSARMGDVRRAVDLGERALALAVSVSDGFDHQVLEQKLALGHHLRNVGRYGEAVPLLTAAADGFRHGRSALKCDTAEHFLAVAWLQLGQPARAMQLLEHEPATALPRVRAMRLACRALTRHTTGQDAVAPMREALATMNDPEHLWFRLHTLIATAIVPPDEGEAMAIALGAWALTRERFGLALAAQVRAAGCALAQGAASRAVPYVHGALRLAQGYQADVFYLPELWWVAAQVNGVMGHEAARAQALAEGARWVARTVAEHVPSEFRDSFLRRNRVNAELLSAARAAGVEP
jgi:DNA-binding SARP family transcriptional activator